jgi:hypothetical protein
MEEWVPDVQEMLAQAANVDMKYFGEITIRRLSHCAKLLREFFRCSVKLRNAVTIPGSIAVDTAGGRGGCKLPPRFYSDRGSLLLFAFAGFGEGVVEVLQKGGFVGEQFLGDFDLD